MSSKEEYAPLSAVVQYKDVSLDNGGDHEAIVLFAASRRSRRVKLLAALLLVAAAAAAALAASVASSGESWGRPAADGEGFAAGAAIELAVVEEDCHTAKTGERCHTDVVYAMRNRHLHPEWYIGLDNCSTFADFQAFMHTQVLNSGERRCPRPCSHPGHGARATGAKCKAEKTEKNCHTAVPGDECYSHVLYTKKEAIKYPRWYPGLRATSSLKDVQHYLKEENVCPEPCNLVNESSISENITGCHTALPGETCYEDILQAKHEFIYKHPEWYKGLTNSSTRDQFQAFLHNQRHVDAEASKKACPNPCNQDAVDEVEVRAICKTAEAHDPCYESVLWGATKGMEAHPEWYNGIAGNSSFEEFQLHLHKDNHTKCHHVPCPCHTAVRGEPCYWSILWVLRTGIRKYPKTFKGLSNKSSLEEVQAHLHKERTSTCGRPCKTFPDDPRSVWRSTFLELSEA